MKSDQTNNFLFSQGHSQVPPYFRQIPQFFESKNTITGDNIVTAKRMAKNRCKFSIYFGIKQNKSFDRSIQRNLIDLI